MGMNGWIRRVLPVVVALALLGPLAVASSDERFNEATNLVRAGDYPAAMALYEELAADGHESPSLYWNWGQAALARGAHGEALWALLRARELDPGDRAVRRETERIREALNLDPAEIAPEPLAGVARVARRYRLDLVAAVLLLLSVGAHVVARLRPGSRWPAPAAWMTLGLGLVVAAAPAASLLARPTAVVVRRGAPLLDAASPTAEALATLREGEVVPVLKPGETWLQIEDASGARGWAHRADVRPLEGPPAGPGAP
jgi:hypothetical protein